jgi:hypothetical protein
MNIDEARNLKVGQRVRYPDDYGNPGGVGTVTRLPTGDSQTSYCGETYLWVSVRMFEGHEAAWPSNRLGRLP